MTLNNQQEDVKNSRRPDKTYPKHISLTEFGREKIATWAQANGINFSAAIETLALMALDDDRSSYAIPALRATTLQGIRLSFNRMARLMFSIAIEAAVARTMSEGIMLQLIRELATEHPDDFVSLMRVSRDGRQKTHARMRAFHEDIKAHVEQEAIRRLKRPIADVHQLFSGEEEEEMHG